jgi:2-alkyl-3-oxoalkanoate reductase
VKQRVVVHGAESFVGRRLCAALAASDWAEPMAVATRDAGLTAAVSAADAVARCVTGTPAMLENGLLEVFAAAAASPRRPRVVHLGSMSVYGSAAGLVDEDSELRADLGAYSRAQLAAERIALGYANSVVLRPGGEYGPNCVHWTLHIARLLQAGRLGQLQEAGNGFCNLLYIDDLVAAIVAALRVPQIDKRVFNLGLPDPPTWNEYFAQFARALGCDADARVGRGRLAVESNLVAPLLRAAAGAMRIARIAAPELPPAITASMRALWTHTIRLDVGRAERTLDLRWTDRQRGLAQAAAWCRQTQKQVG